MKVKEDDRTVVKELELIFQNPQFVNSEKEKKLLAYLVTKTLASEYIKEAHIAIDVFNKEDGFDPALDSTVRVYIGKLRNKLEKFYLSDDSKKSTIKISIPKGHYDVKFDIIKRNKKLGRLKLISALFIFFTLVLITAFAIHLIGDKNDLFSDSKKVSNNPVWKDYSKSELPTLIVVGDFFFMTKRIDNKRYIVRDTQINSKFEFIQSGDDTLGFSDFAHTYSPSEMSGCITNFIPFLINGKKSFKIKKASLLTWEDINSSNIIFVGEFKTLYILNRLLPRFNIKYDLTKKSYFLLNSSKEPISEFNFNQDPDGFRDDYIIVSKRPGGNGNIITLILTLGRGGIKNVTEKLSDSQFLTDFTETYQKDKRVPFYFDVVFKIEGLEGATLNSEIVYFNQFEL